MAPLEHGHAPRPIPGRAARAHFGRLAGFEIDPRVAGERKRERERRLHTIVLPRLRLLGFLGLAGIVALHNLVRGFDGGFVAAAWFALAASAYALVSWGALFRWFGRTGRVHLGDAFLGADLVFLAGGVLASGAEASLLFYLPFVRVVDQIGTGFRRCLVFVALAFTTSLLLVCLFILLAHPVDLGIESAKILGCTLVALYIATIARVSERVRERSRAAIGLARELIEELQVEQTRTEEAGRTKAAFLANVSHEIRTPLHGVIGMTDLVLRSDLDAEQRECLHDVLGSAESLLRILDDVLDFSKLEAGRFTLTSEPFDLRDRLGEGLRGLAARAHAKGVRFRCHVGDTVPDRVVGDPLRLGQVIANLVGNALKFTDRGEVRLAIDDAGAGRLAFSVRDTGPGIGAAERELVFEAFRQADDGSTRRHGGTGLGLAIARELVRSMGGDIRLASEVGVGSEFVFVLDLPRADGAAPEPVELDRPVHLWSVDARWTRSVRAVLARRGLTVRDHGPDPADELEAGVWIVELDDLDRSAAVERLRAAGHPCVLVTCSTRPEADLGVPPLERCRRLVPPVLGSELPAVVAELASRGEERPGAGAPLRTGRPLRVLIVEDNPINLRLARLQLGRWGHHVEFAEHGRAGIDAWRAGGFDVVLMDVQMPELDGLEATRRIRGEEAARGLPRTPIVALTADAMPGDVDCTRAAGMDHHVSKPVDFRALFDLLERLGAEQTEARASA